MDRIEDETLRDIGSEVQFAWQNLAQILGFDQNEITAFKADWPGERITQAVQMLTVWRDRYNEVDAKGYLIRALRILDRYDILHKLGAESFDDNALKRLASGVRDAWRGLAECLGVHNSDCAVIIINYPGKTDRQAGCMLRTWRTEYQGINMITHLAAALKKMGRCDLMETIGIMDNHTIDELADNLGESWPAVASHVGFDEADVANITQVVPQADRARHMLRLHRETHGGFVRMEELKIAVKKTGRPDLLKFFLGIKFLDIATIEKVASLLGRKWHKVAMRLRLDSSDVEMILAREKEPAKQAELMLFLWMKRYTEVNEVEYLARVLIAAKHEDIANKELGPLLQLQPCDSCGSDDPCKFRCYFSKDNDGSTQLIGICCGSCDQEWLQERFLFHPDIDNTRPTRQLGDSLFKKQLEVPMEENVTFQVKITDFHSIHVGDHIAWRRPYFISHHAIVLGINSKAGKVKVIHWYKEKWSSGSNIIIMDTLIDLETERGELFRINYTKKFTTKNPPELVIARAKSRLVGTDYGLLGDNCEALASYCKTGVSESSQVVWFYNERKDVVRFILEIIFFLTFHKFRKSIEKLSTEHVNEVSAGIILAIAGIVCVCDVDKFYKARKSGNKSRKYFLVTASKHITAFSIKCAVGLIAVVGCAGLFPTAGFVGTMVGSILSCVLGSIVLKRVGLCIGSYIGRAVASMIATDDRAVTMEKLNPGDQVVFYGNSLHPRHHVIVVDKFPAKGKVKVIHNTYWYGVIEEIVEFTEPAYRLVYDKCNPPEEVLKRARSKIGDDTYRYSLAWNNCKTFAKWCKLEC